MANIRIKDLPADGAPKQTDLIPIDLGSTRHATVKAVVESGRPTASKTEAEVGVEPKKAMTPLTTKQAIDAQVGAAYVPKTVKVNAGSGMTGGGALSGDVTVGLTVENVDRLTKVDGIESGATKNQTDSYLLARANHTGTQAIGTVSGLQGALDNKLAVDGIAADSNKLGGETAQEWADKINVGGIYDTKAAAEAANIPSSVNAIRLNGYHAAGDGGGGLYVRVPSEPNHAGKIMSLDGSWWELVYNGFVSPLQFGRYLGVNQDNSPAVQACFDYVKAKNISLPVVDLCGLEYGIASGITCAQYRTEVRNGRFYALGTAGDWGDTAMFAPINKAWRVTLFSVEFNGNLVANLINEEHGTGFRIIYVSGYRYKDYGITYTGAGCYYSNFTFQKFTGGEPERARTSARSQGWGLDIRSPDGRIHCGVVHGQSRTTSSSWAMLISQVHFYNSSEARDSYTGNVGNVTLSPTWEVDDVTHIRVEKNGSVLTSGSGYTATLSPNGRPQVTISGLVRSDTIDIKALTPDVISLEVRGSTTDFDNCYFDNGYVDIYNMDNRFSGIGLYLSDRVKLDSHVRIFTATPNQTIGNLKWDVRRANQNLKVFGFHTIGSGSWNANTAHIENLTNVKFSQNAEANVRGSTGSAIVDIKVSGNARAFTQYQSTGTSTIVASGANGNEYEIMTDGSTKFRITRQGSLFAGTTQITNPDGFIKLKPLTKATLPTPSGATSQCIAYISDGDDNKKIVVCDGSSWRYMDGTSV